MELVLIGYFPKKVAARPESLRVPRVEEICSVSECISPGPKGWVEKWLHNEMWLFDTEALALQVVPDDARSDFTLFAYKMLPALFDKGTGAEFRIPRIAVEPLPQDYAMLGYDAVSRSSGNKFECSPLSCNGMAQAVATNRHCLLGALDAALSAAKSFSLGACEPGPYCVIEVWRKLKCRKAGMN